MLITFPIQTVVFVNGYSPSKTFNLHKFVIKNLETWRTTVDKRLRTKPPEKETDHYVTVLLL